MEKTPNPAVTRGYGLLELFLAKQRAKIAEKLIPDGHNRSFVLDIGCGSYPLFLYNTTFDQKYGIDKIQNQEFAVELQAHGINLTDFDIEKQEVFPLEDNMFDVITMLAVVEHIEPERLPIIFKEIHRVLKPGGIYILTTPALWTHGLLKGMAKVKLVSPIEIEEHKFAYTPRVINYILRAGNFSAGNIKIGSFELFMNIWATAAK